MSTAETPFYAEVVQEYPHIILIGKDKTPPSVPEEDLRRSNPFFKNIMTTDFSISGTNAEPIRSSKGTLLGYRYPSTGVISVDHHFEEPEMWRNVSSANLAIEYKTDFPYQSSASPVHITHTDTDSILAAGILADYIKPEDRYGIAAVAADHTGEENEIGDILMAIEPLRDVAYSMAVLNAYLRGEDLPEKAQRLLEKRRSQRERARELVNSGEFVDVGNGVRVADLSEPIPGELLPSLLPDASLILLVAPMKEKPGFYEVKTRTGLAFPEGVSLHSLRMPGWGGRWDAGSTKRHGGTQDPAEFISYVVDTLPTILE